MATLAASRAVPAVRTAALGARFDWLVLAASAWLLGGLFWDG